MATKIPFRTAFSERVRKTSPVGKKYQMEHNPVMGQDGRRRLEKTRRVEIYERIQSHKEECDINNIIARHLNGDPFAINKKIGNFMDLTEVPKTIAEAQQIVINLSNEFEKLPLEIRERFQNNAEIYVASFGTDEWLEKTGTKARMEAEAAKKLAAETFQKTYEQAITNMAKGGEVNE